MNVEDKEYLASGRWKCADSPTGAHRWIEVSDEEGHHTLEFHCYWCHEVRKFPVYDLKRVYKETG